MNQPTEVDACSPHAAAPRAVFAWRRLRCLARGPLLPSGPADADSGLTISTPYPSIATQPGSTVKFDVSVSAGVTESVDLDVPSLPDGWTATLRGGGFVVQSVTATPDEAGSVTLEVAIPPDATGGEYPIVLTGSDGVDTRELAMRLMVQEQVDTGIQLTADFPSLRGDPGTAFSYTLTITNNTPEGQTFTFSPEAPQGWAVTASPTAEAKAATVTIEAGATSNVTVTATPPDTAAEGSYPINVTVAAANGASGNIELTADVTGTPTLSLGTADQRLDVSGRADNQKRLSMVVANTGTAAVEDVKFAATAPTGWRCRSSPTSSPVSNPTRRPR